MGYDIAIVGGGIAGSSLAVALARQGARVLIIERERAFRDRNRGELIHPWGVVEAQKLGIYQPLATSCGLHLRWWVRPRSRRDLTETTPSRVGCLSFYHPQAQETLLALAVAAGAELWRPARAVRVEPGSQPAVSVRVAGGHQRAAARLVVGADGRNSNVRTWADFPTKRDPQCLYICGVLFHGIPLPEDSIQAVSNPYIQQNAMVIPVGGRRFRSYLMRRCDSHPYLSGGSAAPEFVSGCLASGGVADWFRGAEIAGPLASFNAADRWTDLPYRDGIVLIGDAAASSDPCFGSGLSLALRDVRVLRDHLLSATDWAQAANNYAEKHRQYYNQLRKLHGWTQQLFFGVGPEADRLRAQAIPKLVEDQSRRPDVVGLGPDAPSCEAAQSRFFGQD